MKAEKKTRTKKTPRTATAKRLALKPKNAVRCPARQTLAPPEGDKAFYQALVEDQTEIISRFKADGTFTYVNDVYCRFFGKTREELIGRKWLPQALPEDVPMIVRELELLSPHNSVVVIENRVFDAHGDIRWMQFINRGFFDGRGRLSETQSVGRDISELKLTEEALRESEAKWKFAVESVGEGVWDWDVKSGKAAFSSQWKRMLGYEDEELTDDFEEWRSRVHPDDLLATEALVKDFVEGHTPTYSAEFRMRCKDGTWKWIHARGMAISRDSNGRPLRIVGRHTDVSERKAAREREAANLRRVAEGAPCQAVLDAIARSVESDNPGLLCCVMLVGPGGGHFLTAAAPSLPEYYRKGINGLTILPDMASSGGAVVHGTRVIVEDVTGDPRWKDLRKLVKRAGLKSCWSQPVIGRKGQVLGTIACYRRVIHSPPRAEIATVEDAARLVALAVEREADERTLRQSEMRHRSIMESKLAGLMFWRLDGTITEANDALLEMVGYDREDMRSSRVNWATMTPPEFRAVDERALSELLAHGHVTPFEKEYIRKDGSRVPVMIGGALFPNSSSEGVSFVIDITDRSKAERALQESELRYRLLADHIDNIVVLNDTKGNRLFISPSYYRKTGWTEAEVMSTDWRTRMHPDDLANVEKAREANIRGELTCIEHRMRCKDGSWRWFETNCKPIRDQDGKVWRLLVWSKDITSKRIAEAALRESEEKFRLIFENADDAIIITRGNKFSDCNDVTLKMFGCGSRDQFIGRSPWQFSPASQPDGRDSREAALGIITAAGTGVPQRFEWWHQRLDGTPFLADVTLNKLVLGGEVVLQGIVRDISDRKKAEQAMRESEARYARAVRGTSDGLWDWNITTGETYFSPRWKALLGFDEQELESNREKNYRGRLHPDDLPRVDAMLKAHLEERQPYDIEVRLRTKDGAYRWFRVRGEAERDACGQPTRMAGSLTDITEQKNAEDALRESEHRFRAVFEQAAVGVSITDVNTGRYVRVNQRYCDIAGLTEEQMTATTFMAITHPEDHEESIVANERLRRREIDRIQVEKRIIRPDGNIVWVHISVSPLWRQGEEPSFNITIAEDITDRKKAEADYRREFDFNTALVRHTSALILVTDLKGNIIHANPAFTKVLGYKLEDIKGHPAWKIGMMDADEVRRSKDRFTHLAAGEDNPPTEIRLRTTSGEIRIVEIWGTSSRDAEGNVERIIVTGMDVTDKNRLRNEVLRISEQEQARIGNDLHDGVGQTMTGIASLLEALESGLAGSQKTLASRIRELMQESVAEVRRMSHGLSPAGVKNRGIDGGLQLLAETIRTNYRTGSQCDIEPGIKITDPEMETHLFRIAQEAVNNAMRHGKPKLVSLSLKRRAPGECLLQIEDDGSGIKARQGKNKGNGIGVRVMDYRASLIGGTLTVTSRPKGGVVVSCRFPLDGVKAITDATLPSTDETFAAEI